MVALSCEQKAIVGAPLVPLSVVACAGSGKTTTAVHRVTWLANELQTQRGFVALLSFSNVAVRTFRREYKSLASRGAEGKKPAKVVIDTADSFFSANVLRPHSPLTMNCHVPLFLITGNEPFLNNPKFKCVVVKKDGTTFPGDVDGLRIFLAADAADFQWARPGGGILMPVSNGLAVVDALGAVGGYTHEMGRYWVYRTLVEQPRILAAMVRRYPHIFVDEGQDVGSMHKGTLTLLRQAGVCISVIGDPDQAIYEFIGADGSFMKEHGGDADTKIYPLTMNFRSVPEIVSSANLVAKRDAKANRLAPATTNGAYVIPYSSAGKLQLIQNFTQVALNAGLSLERCAVVCRSSELVKELRGTESDHGVGAVKHFVTAAVLRDARLDYFEAFRAGARGVIALLQKPAPGLLYKLSSMSRDEDSRPLRHLIWSFVRDEDHGLPSCALHADKEWHAALVARVKLLLEEIRAKLGLQPAQNIGSRLAKKKLSAAPLTSITSVQVGVRIDTVHQVKGESLDAVLYVATKTNAVALINGVDSEDGRVGYVALTRARDLIWLGIPDDTVATLAPALKARGFGDWPVAPN